MIGIEIVYVPHVVGRAVVVGPHMENFQEIADEFRAEGAMVQVASPEELGPQIAALLLDSGRRGQIASRARELVERNRGAVARSADALVALLK